MDGLKFKQSFSSRTPGKPDVALRIDLSGPRVVRPEDELLKSVVWRRSRGKSKSWCCFWHQHELPILFGVAEPSAFDALEHALTFMWRGVRYRGLRDSTLFYANGRRVPVEAMKTDRTADKTQEEIEAAMEGRSCAVPEKGNEASEAEWKALIAYITTLPTEEEDSEGRTFERHDWLAERALHVKGGAGAPDTPVSVKIALPHLQKPEHAPRAAHLMEVNGEIWACPVALSPFMGEGFVYGPDRISAMHAGIWFLSTALEVLARKHSFETSEGEAFRLPFQDHFIIPWDEPPAQGIPTGFVLPEWSPLSV